MKTLFIEAQKKSNINIDSINFNVLPDEILLAYSIQYNPLALNIKKKIEKFKKVAGFKQVLGCSQLKSKIPILLIGSGRFHALNLALQGNRVYIIEGNTIKEFDNKETEKIRMRRKAALSKFYAADKIGILVSCKPGQENLALALKIKKKLEKQGKSCFLFLADNININELENYNIQSWVNTACPGIAFDALDSLSSTIVNIQELKV